MHDVLLWVINLLFSLFSDRAQPFLFTQAQLEQAIAKGKTVCISLFICSIQIYCTTNSCCFIKQTKMVNCRGVDIVSIYALAPDLVMMELNRPIIKYEDMEIREQVAVTSRTKVVKAHMGDEQLAVKQFLSEVMSASSFTSTASSNDFRAQVWSIRFESLLQLVVFFSLTISIYSGLEHPNIVRLKGFCITPLCLVVELAGHSSLATHLQGSHKVKLSTFQYRAGCQVKLTNHL